MKIVLKTETSLDVSSLFLNDSYSDCIIKSSDNKEFKAHRVILAKRTDFFNAMLSSDMIEGNLKVISLPESYHILSLLFGLMYGQECKGNRNDFMKLCVATKKYLMKELHQECLTKLALFLDASCAIEMLIFACDNDFKDISNLSMKLILEHFNYIYYHSDTWKLMFDRPDVLRILFDEYVRDFNQVIDQERKQYNDESLSALDIINGRAIINSINQKIQINAHYLEKLRRLEANVKREQQKNQEILQGISERRIRSYEASCCETCGDIYLSCTWTRFFILFGLFLLAFWILK